METRETATQQPDAFQSPDQARLIATFTDRAASLGVAVIRVADSDGAAAEVATIAAKVGTSAPLVSTELAQSADALMSALVSHRVSPSPPGGPDETNDAPL